MGIEQQNGDSVAAFKYQPPLVAAHCAVVATMSNDHLVNFEKIVKQPILTANLNPPVLVHGQAPIVLLQSHSLRQSRRSMTVMNKIDDVVKKDLAGGQGDRDENEIEKPEITRLIW
jgi:hypothetical protein